MRASNSPKEVVSLCADNVLKAKKRDEGESQVTAAYSLQDGWGMVDTS